MMPVHRVVGSRHPSLTGVLCLFTGVFIYFYGDLCPKFWTPQPNWPHILVYGDLCPKLWTPQPNLLDIFMYGDSCPTLWTPQPNWLEIFVFRGLYVQSRGHPSLTGLTYLRLGICVQKLWTPLPNWLDIFVYGDLCPKLWTPLLD